jgi:hypothetical protein
MEKETKKKKKKRQSENDNVVIPAVYKQDLGGKGLKGYESSKSVPVGEFSIELTKAEEKKRRKREV